MVKEVEDPEDSAKKLVAEAIKRGSADNITCVVVRFLENKTANTASSSHVSSSSAKETNQMPPLGDLKSSSNKTNALHSDSENVMNRKPIPGSSLTDEVNAKGLGIKPNNSANRKPVSASSSTDAVTIKGLEIASADERGSGGETKQTPVATALLKSQRNSVATDKVNSVSSIL